MDQGGTAAGSLSAFAISRGTLELERSGPGRTTFCVSLPTAAG